MMVYFIIALCFWIQVENSRAADFRLPGIDLLSFAGEMEANLKSNLQLSDEQESRYKTLFNADPGYEAWKKSIGVKETDSSFKASSLDSYLTVGGLRTKWEEERIRRWSECLSPLQIKMLRTRFLKDKGMNGCGPFLNAAILDACHVSPTEVTAMSKVASQASKVLNDKLGDARRVAVQNVIDTLSHDSKKLFSRYAGIEYTTEVNANHLPAQENLQQVPFSPTFFKFYAFYVPLTTREFQEFIDLKGPQNAEIIKIKNNLKESSDKTRSKIEYKNAENLAYHELLSVISPEQQTAALRRFSCMAFEKDFVTPFSDPLFVSFLTLNAADALVTRNIAKLEAEELEAIESNLNREAFESLIQRLSAESALEMRRLLGDLW